MGYKKKIPKIAKDIRGVKLKEDDWCWFWNDGPTRVKYQFLELYHRDPSLYISVDKKDKKADNDLSWWKNCEKIKG